MICRNKSAEGQLSEKAIQIRRTLIRICAPILNSFKRIVSHWALAIVVPCSPTCRSVCISTYANEEKYNRN